MGSDPKRFGDPRKLGGGIAGPGGPFDEGENLIDTRNSVLLDSVDVAMVDNPSDGRQFASLLLSGRVNRSPERTSVLYLFDADGAAAIVTELVALAGRKGGQYATDFQRFVEFRFAEMPKEPGQ